MDLVQIANEKLAELADKRHAFKSEIADIEAQMKAIRAQRDLLTGETKTVELGPVPMRVETDAERDAMNAKIAATAKRRGRKAGAKRDKTIGEKILEFLGHVGGADVATIAGAVVEGQRSVSFTLQNLKRAGKVERNGSLWSRMAGAAEKAPIAGDFGHETEHPGYGEPGQDDFGVAAE